MSSGYCPPVDYQTMSLGVAQTMSPCAVGCAEAVVAPISPKEMAATTPRTARRALRRIDDMADLSWGCELGWCWRAVPVRPGEPYD